MPNAQTVDLTNCDREPIHIPGSIQPHGCLIACSADAARVERHSANAADVLGLPAGDINGQSLDAMVGSRLAHDLRNALTTVTNPARPALMLGVEVNGRSLDIAVHRHKGATLIEFEPAPTGKQISPVELGRALVSQLSRLKDESQLLKRTTRLVQGLLGYDRVMIYRFEHDGSGKVVSESKTPALESFLGQYFPASDIPKQARELYLRNTLRIVSDTEGHYIPLVPVLDASGEPLDLSYAHLRSVSPIHCEYLRNMGVSASMSLSIVVGGELWGLIACHHYSPRVLSMSERIGAEMFGEFFSLHLEAVNQRAKLDTATRARATLDRILRHASRHMDLSDLLASSLPEFSTLMPANGIGLWMNGTWSGSGNTPPASEIPALARLVGQASDGRVWATHALAQALPEAAAYSAEVSGVLAISLSQRAQDYLFFFRKEVVQTLEWAGNPDKQYATGVHGDRLTPRKSFAIWKQTVERQSTPWTAADREIAEAARTALVEVVLRHNELLADERSKAEVRQRLLNEELNHRVKNILALIKSLVSHPVAPGTGLETYISTLAGRIKALAHAHDQVVRGDGGGILGELLAAELSPYRDQSAVALSGPPVLLDARAFSVMALVLHELATNAAKYGALSVAAGQLDVQWSATADGSCEIVWTESSGPTVRPPERRGFGSVLVDRSVPYDLNGESRVDYLVSGVRARFLLPARYVSWPSAPVAAEGLAAARGEAEGGAPALDGVAVLLVEDQLLIAIDVETMLLGQGARTVETASSAAEAIGKLGHFRPDVAVLDVNLGSGTSVPVAQELRRRGIPFVFASGYADLTMIPEELSGAPLARKPYDVEALALAIVEACAGPQAATA
ncbi:signal transduction histidine kinase [Azorhizobium oxalatiphilum]|uniref:histidine kinase n=1 Tax=Azorhizobium oxalatiphilum TaxID=980631 RepID=A0A917BJ23_9HYPH|nr:HWE histidine kinase domain-containing protein [Azorhizobium oxalatiphilum]GGF45579.1 signal transduction histidine kinase [Azorhizobium oxalatiphilum]